MCMSNFYLIHLPGTALDDFERKSIVLGRSRSFWVVLGRSGSFLLSQTSLDLYGVMSGYSYFCWLIDGFAHVSKE